MSLNDYLVGIRWHDAIVVGAGHDGLVCAAALGRAGMKVIVLEAREAIGGGARTERPFAKVPELATPVGACTHAAIPAEVTSALGIELPTIERDPHTVFLSGGASDARRGEGDGRSTRVAIRGGIGTAAHMVADRAIAHGAIVETEARVGSIVIENGAARGVVLKDGTPHHAAIVVCNADPIVMRDLVGHERLEADDVESRPVTRVSLALREPPRFSAMPGAFDQAGFGPAIVLGPPSEIDAIEWTVSTALDPSLRDPAGHHDSAIVAPGHPALDDVLAACERFAPGLRERVVDAVVRHENDVVARAPRAIATAIPGLYSCHATTRGRSRGVAFGAAGLAAAARVLEAGPRR